MFLHGQLPSREGRRGSYGQSKHSTRKMSDPAALPITILATSLGFVVVQLDGSILNVALPQIGISLGTSVDGLQWTVDAYFLVFAVLLLSAGVLSDRMGARRAFVSGFTVFSAASLACTLAPSPVALIGARAVQGAGAALLVPCSLALLNNACGDDAGVRARAIGIWTAAGAAGSATGTVLGGLLVGFIGWRSIFLVNLPISLIGIWLTLRFIDKTTNCSQSSRGPDLAGQTLAIFALVGLVGAIIEAGSLGWRAPLVLLGLALAILGGSASSSWKQRLGRRQFRSNYSAIRRSMRPPSSVLW
jgi:DHA2 family methylenomycin A resistance protein-like MFS transporter